MINYGDVTKIKGNEVPPVDVITFGAPCQDLSIAGKRKGLKHEDMGDDETTRSGLFFEAIRIIKEMRNETRQLSMRRSDEHIRPRFAVYENVYGAFSSNHGEDFRTVLEETVRIKDPDAHIPGPPKDGWPHAGVIIGTGYSVAWRGHDAQWWGVPQRRKRVCVLADFDGTTAGKVLFESQLFREADECYPNKAESDFGEESRSKIQPFTESVQRNPEQGGKEGQGVTRTFEDSIGAAISFQERAGKPGGGKGILIQNEKTGALSTLNNQSVICFEPGSASRVGNHVYEESTGTLRANAGDNQQAVCYGISPDENPDSNHGGVAIIGKCLNSWDVQSKHIQPEDGIAESLYSGECRGGGGESYVLTTKENQKAVCYGISPFDSNAMKSSNPHSGIYEADTSRTLDLNGGSPACNQGGMAVVQGVDLYNQTVTGDVSKTLNAIKSDSDHVPCIAYGLDRASFNQGQNAQFNFSVDEELSPPIVAKGPGGVLARQ